MARAREKQLSDATKAHIAEEGLPPVPDDDDELFGDDDESEPEPPTSSVAAAAGTAATAGATSAPNFMIPDQTTPRRRPHPAAATI